MRKIVFGLFLSVLLFASCSHEKKSIEFKKMANIDLGNLSHETATLHGTAVFMNFSDQEYELKDMVLDFTIDGKDIGTVVTKTKKIIQPNSEFSVPINYTYETTSFIKEGDEPAKSYAVELLGDLTSKDAKGNELGTSVKYATTYDNLTGKEKRIQKREERRERRRQKND